ncbi:hypothetical protein CRYUN_Cryun04dG0201100 [Craigia yunnanensis]
MLSCRLQLPPQPLLKPLSTARPTTKDGGLLFRQKLLYLQSLNVNPHKALNLNPSLRSTPISSLLSLEHSLSSFGLSRPSIGRILDMYPLLLTSLPPTLSLPSTSSSTKSLSLVLTSLSPSPVALASYSPPLSPNSAPLSVSSLPLALF